MGRATLSHFWASFLILAGAGSAVIGCETSAPSQRSVDEVVTESRRGREGRLVIIGGALQADNAPVYGAVLEARWGEGPLCVLPTASGTPTNSMEGYVDDFDALAGEGASEGILLTTENRGEAENEEMADRLRACSGFFFTGGVQSRILEVFLPDGMPTAAYHALWERYQAGAVVAGSSAGAAIMSDPMIAGGSSGGALREGVRASEEGEGVWLTRGLGFLRQGLVDQHFLARGRWARLLVGVLAAQDDSLGFGIDENTALVVEGDSAWVVGESGVLFFDARRAVKEEEGNGGYGVRTFLLGEGDGVDLQTATVRWGDGKDPLPEGDHPFADPDGELFSRGSLLQVLSDFALSPDRRVTFHQEGHVMEFRKEPGFRAMGRRAAGAETTPEDLFLGPFVLSVWRE